MRQNKNFLPHVFYDLKKAKEKRSILVAQTELFGKEKISKILIRLAPRVMLAQPIQALYNIVDSFFVGKYSGSGLTSLSIIYSVQLLMIALA